MKWSLSGKRLNDLNNEPLVSGEQTASRKGVLRSAFFMTLLTFLSRMLGLVREQVRGYYLGTGMGSDAFGLASAIPNLFRRLLAEGAMTAAFVPVFSDYVKKDNRRELGEFLSSFLSLFTVLLVVVTLGGMALSPWLIHTFFSTGFGQVEGKVALTIALTEWMFPYLFLVSLAAIIQAVLNSFKIFSPSAFTPVLLNLCIILGTIALHDRFEDPSYAMAAGFLLGGFLQLAFQIPWFIARKIPLRLSFRWNHPGVRELLRIFTPGAFAAGIYQVNVFVSEMIASSLSQGSIAALQYSIRLQELVLGVFVISMTTVILPTLSGQRASGDKAAFNDTNRFALRILALVTLPATVGLILLRVPIVALLFQHGAFDARSTGLTSLAVLFHSLGIYFIAMSRSLNQTFYAMKDLKTPMVIALVSMLVNIAGCLVLTIPLEHGGIALANSLSALVSTLLAFFWLSRREDVSLGILVHLLSVLRVLAASAIMAVAVLLLLSIWPYEGASKMGLLLRVSTYLLTAIVVLAFSIRLVAREEWNLVAGAVSFRVRRRK